MITAALPTHTHKGVCGKTHRHSLENVVHGITVMFDTLTNIIPERKKHERGKLLNVRASSDHLRQPYLINTHSSPKSIISYQQ